MEFRGPIVLVMAGAAFSRAITALNNRYTRNIKRAEQLAEAEGLLTAHYDALERFMSDAAAPDHLKDILMWFSDASADHDVACELVASLAGGSKINEVDQMADTKVDSSLKSLATHRPDLIDLYEKAVMTGILATYLRWDETAIMFERLVAKTASRPGGEILIAAQAARYGRLHTSAGADALMEARQAIPA